MSLRIYNTLTRQKEPFVPVTPPKVGMYLCGPTVYKSPHIGHMVGPVIFDAIKRYLQYRGYQVTWVVNITDVEDKLIDAANKLNSTVEALSQKYTAEYLSVLSDLGVDGIDHFPRATAHMAEIIQICQTLIDKGHAYAVDGNVWFDVTKDADYGKLSHRRVEDQEAGNRDMENTGKRNPADFALWKASKVGEPAWDSPWGKGRPGWHIECSAMSMKILGETFDMHGGGMDLMFPHHENEIAQSECCTGKTFAKYWMHNGLTRLRTKSRSGEWSNEKMSGSIGNVVSARDLLNNFGPELLRYFLLSTHYRSPIEFSDQVMDDSRKGYSVFARVLERVQRILGADIPAEKPKVDLPEPFAGRRGFFESSMDDDFNTAGAIAQLHEFAGNLNAFIESRKLESPAATEQDKATLLAAASEFKSLGRILGLFRFAATPASQGNDELTDKLMQLLIQIRADARKSKNFALADAVRKGLAEIGVTLEDGANGTLWRRA